MDDLAKKDIEAPQKRSFSIQERAINEEARTVEIAFSSEEPYDRYFGTEVLSHNPESVDLSRLLTGAAVLVNHDTDDQIGVVESARIDGDKVGRAVIRFSKSARGQEIFQDVQDGIRQLVSVGYMVNKYETAERKGQSDLVMVTKWTPYELSLVAIPADATVGVGRSVEPPKPEVQTTHVKESIMTTEVEVKPDAPAFDKSAELTKIRTEEARRRSMIDAIADRHDVAELAKQAVSEGWDIATMNEKALEVVGERNNAARAKSKHDGNVDLSPKDTKRFSMLRLMDAIAHPNDRASQQRAGFELEVSAEAVRAFGSDYKVRGQFVPENLLGGRRDLSAGTATDGAELVAANLLPGSYIEVLRNTMVQAALGKPDDRHQALRDAMSELLEMDEPRRHVAAMLSGLDVHYDLSAGHPLLGRRMPDLDLDTAQGRIRVFDLLHEARPVLLNLAGSGDVDIGPWADRVTVVAATHSGAWELPVIGEVPAPAAVLIRPDGYVAWTGDVGQDDLPAALTAWFGAAADR